MPSFQQLRFKPAEREGWRNVVAARLGTNPGVLISSLWLQIQQLRFKLAEREGFEPPDPCGSAVFKTAAIGHSATSPVFSSNPKGSRYRG